MQHVGKVVAGLVIVWAGNASNAGCESFHHYAIDIKSLSLKAKLSVVGGGTVVHPFILPYPPAGFLTPATRHASDGYLQRYVYV